MSLVLMSLFNILNGLNVLNGYKEYFSNFNLLNIYYSSGIIRYHLWYLSTMLFVIPGIIIALTFSQAFYILAKNPEKSIGEVLGQSASMMNGYKMDLFM